MELMSPEEPVAAQLIKNDQEILCLFLNREVRKSPPLVAIMSHMNSVGTIVFYFFETPYTLYTSRREFSPFQVLRSKF